MGQVQSLQPADAVALVHPLILRLADRTRTRVLFIKGPSASFHGLRIARISADADVWVEPGGDGALLGSLGDAGWTRRVVSSLSSELVGHSITLVHPQWPCDIDVHVTFPGFLGDRRRVFDELWARRAQMTLAGASVPVPDRSAAILIAALHALRTPAQTPRHRAEFHGLLALSQTLTESEQSDIVTLANATAAVDTARPFLNSLNVSLPGSTPHGVDSALDAWRVRTGAGGVITAQLWILAAGRPWRERPGLIARALWPDERGLRRDHPDLAPGRVAANRARLARLGRGLRALPAVIRGRRLSRRGFSDESLSERHTHE